MSTQKRRYFLSRKSEQSILVNIEKKLETVMSQIIKSEKKTKDMPSTKNSDKE